MKRAAALLAACFALSHAGQSSTPRVGRPGIEAMERSFNRQLSALWTQDPFVLLGTTRGIYLEGYGAVFTSEVDLAPGPTLNPFHQAMNKENIAERRKRMLERLPKLKLAMATMLGGAASSLDTVPANERLVLGVTLTQYPWEDRTGIPSQVVVSGVKSRLLDAQRAGSLQPAIEEREF